MKTLLTTLLALLCMGSALAEHAHGKIDDSLPDAERIRFCERMRDQALQAFYDREQGRPMKLFVEDGSRGPRIANHITRRIYAEPQIAARRHAETFGRATCNEMMGAAPGSD
ncbi:hypothetical protein [Quatrionicoccus australiensis]|uniref:hypothetical protein n=1 Tax=Quatrionicoccus australiensis TaxID=138118 RepID=UPI001CFB974D|nr:hypothetical protein [Quatrionicoccus australiensis]MCB4358706.1 hypothetical protein [Quatrionicoccus australiensis]